MNYSSLRKTLARDLRAGVRAGLPLWAKGHVEERIEYAAHWWRISRDRSRTRDFRDESYMRAVRLQLGLLQLLSAYRFSNDGSKAVLTRPKGIDTAV